MTRNRIGVYICHCGGNIGDYVEAQQVRDAAAGEPGVLVARTAMFTCSDATQQEIIEDIRENELEALVVASCSPKLHQSTFREVARRAGLNPYRYIQVNIREQCSWAHTDDRSGATEKAIRLVRAGIAKARLSLPLDPLVVETVPRVLVVGSGIAGLRAAVGLADIGLEVMVVERKHGTGGQAAALGRMYPGGRGGDWLVNQLLDQVTKSEKIKIYTGAELVSKSGSFGNFQVRIRINATGEEIEENVGTVVIATGFESYQPGEGMFGFGLEGVVTLSRFYDLLASGEGQLSHGGRPARSIAYVYCSGSRQKKDVEGANQYCSRYCCNAAVHASILAAARDPDIRQYHLYRDMRTYGKFELMYNRSREEGSVYVKYDPDDPPVVGWDNRRGLQVTVKDLLTSGEELEIPVDLVVLVTGMMPAQNGELVKLLKLPLGKDRFYNEIHPKLRPVETVVDGVFICGACQGPKNSNESVASALAAAAQSAAILKKGYAELEPLVAVVDPDRCDNCGQCYAACIYDAIEETTLNGQKRAKVNRAVCKGCGACVPVCPRDAADLLGYTGSQVLSMIDGMLKEIN